MYVYATIFEIIVNIYNSLFFSYITSIYNYYEIQNIVTQFSPGYRVYGRVVVIGLGAMNILTNNKDPLS